ncbi:MAG: hypothetical protein A2Y25_02045 [Candidatus Melainabacteria bacterium GWF2_37_15]|nr:MAG: hypothetical protein A2Y25_02045 [Candidatus Melainabacteria bacterium GWF2_37_15]
MNNTVHIYGCSDSIRGLKKPESPSIGLNRFPVYYPDVDYWMFVDLDCFNGYVKDNYKDQKIVTQKYNFYFYMKYSGIKPHHIFEPNKDLIGSQTVATFALDYAIQLGYKKAILHGIMDSEYKETDNMVEWKHFYDDKVLHIEKDRFDEMQRKIDSYKDRIEIIKC